MATKADLITQLSTGLGVTKKQAKAFVNVYAAQIKATLVETGEALVPGVGKLKLKQRAARTGRNPQTGAALEIPARRTVRLAPAKSLKTYVAG